MPGRIKTWVKRTVLFTGITVVLLLAAIFYCDRQVTNAAKGKTFSDTQTMPAQHVGLLLGTGKYLSGGALNPYYTNRIDAAVQLLKEKKMAYLVISGDNSRKEYNEPAMMKADLVANGIDSTRLFLDYAGFRTFDSMVRLKEIFSQDSVIVISQEFHNQRALFIAQREGITATAFNAKDVSYRAGIKTQLREKLARVKVYLDYLFNTKAKFLGEKVNIPQ